MALPEILTRKFGPLPGWGWGALLVGGALVVSALKGKGDAPADDSTGYPVPETLTPTYVFQNYDQDVSYGGDTTVNLPPGGGRPPWQPGPRPIPGHPRPIPAPPPVPPPVVTPVPPAAPKGAWVTVTPWRSGQPAATPSTLWGMAEQVYGRGKGGMWGQIWNAPQNATLKGKRKDPTKVQPGDRFWVPK